MDTHLNSTEHIDSEERRLRKLARSRVEARMGFYTHALVFVCVNAGLWLIGGLNEHHRWGLFPTMPWALGLAIHGLVVMVSQGGVNLQQTMIERELAELRRRQQR